MQAQKATHFLQDMKNDANAGFEVNITLKKAEGI